MGLQGSELADHFWMLYEDLDFWKHVAEYEGSTWDDAARCQIDRNCFPFDLWDGSESMNKDPENQRNNKRHISRLSSSVCRNALAYDLRGKPWGRWRAESWDVPVNSPKARLFPIGRKLNIDRTQTMRTLRAPRPVSS
jgi:hypothetical protein